MQVLSWLRSVVQGFYSKGVMIGAVLNKQLLKKICKGGK